MKYIVFPSEKLDEIPQEMLDELHLTPRKSVDGTQVIMKIVHYEALFPSIMTLPLLDEEEKTENPSKITKKRGYHVNKHGSHVLI